MSRKYERYVIWEGTLDIVQEKVGCWRKRVCAKPYYWRFVNTSNGIVVKQYHHNNRSICVDSATVISSTRDFWLEAPNGINKLCRDPNNLMFSVKTEDGMKVFIAPSRERCDSVCEKLCDKANTGESHRNMPPVKTTIGVSPSEKPRDQTHRFDERYRQRPRENIYNEIEGGAHGYHIPEGMKGPNSPQLTSTAPRESHRSYLTPNRTRESCPSPTPPDRSPKQYNDPRDNISKMAATTASFPSVMRSVSLSNISLQRQSETSDHYSSQIHPSSGVHFRKKEENRNIQRTRPQSEYSRTAKNDRYLSYSNKRTSSSQTDLSTAHMADSFAHAKAYRDSREKETTRTVTLLKGDLENDFFMLAEVKEQLCVAYLDEKMPNWNLHLGDIILSMNRMRCNSVEGFHKMVASSMDDEVNIEVQPSQFGEMCFVQLPAEKHIDSLGLKLGENRHGAEVSCTDGDGTVKPHFWLPSKRVKGALRGDKYVNWSLVEINGTPVTYQSTTKVVEHRIKRAGRELALLFLPMDFVEELNEAKQPCKK